MAVTVLDPTVEIAGPQTIPWNLPFTFGVYLTSDITVQKKTSGGTITTMVEGGGSDYTIALNSTTELPSDGQIDFNANLASGDTIIATRCPPLTQPFEPRNFGAWAARSVEEQLDRTIHMIQCLQDQVNRSFKVDPFDYTDDPDDLLAVLPFSLVTRPKTFHFHTEVPYSGQVFGHHWCANELTFVSGRGVTGIVAAPSSTINFYFGTDVTAGAAMYTGDETITDETVGDALSTPDVATVIPAGNWFWMEIITQTSIANFLDVTIRFTEEQT